MSIISTDYKSLPNYPKLPEEFYPLGIEVRARLRKKEDTELSDAKGNMFIAYPVPKSFLTAHDGVLYTKVYKYPIEKMRDFSIPGHNLFRYLMNNININMTHIYISDNDFLEAFNYAKNSKRLYYKGVQELIEAGIIAKKSGSSKCYWINSNVLFNGDRTKISCPSRDERQAIINH